MPNPTVLVTDTTLYHPSEPEGRIFPAGTPWPGDAWTAYAGEAPVKDPDVRLAAALADKTAELDSLKKTHASIQHDLAENAARASTAEAKLQDHEQASIAAGTRATDAETAARGYMKERDEARAQLKAANDKIVALQAEADKVDGLVSQLSVAHQAVADMKDGAAPADPAPKKPGRPKKAAAESEA